MDGLTMATCRSPLDFRIEKLFGHNPKLFYYFSTSHPIKTLLRISSIFKFD